jgi:hypothetical protein
MIGLIEAVFIGQTLALRHKSSLNFNQEFFGQGLSQIVGAFFQDFPAPARFRAPRSLSTPAPRRASPMSSSGSSQRCHCSSSRAGSK